MQEDASVRFFGRKVLEPVADRLVQVRNKTRTRTQRGKDEIANSR